MNALLARLFRNAALPVAGDWTVADDIAAYSLDNTSV
jgi:hypothetical protein